MKTTDRATHREWLNLHLDGELGSTETLRFEEQLAGDSELAAEYQQLSALHAGIQGESISVRSHFRDRVMAALPLPAWLPQPRLSWALPLAMAGLLAIAAAWILGGVSLGESALVGTGFAVADFLVATSMAGAGLLAASWRGLGLALEEILKQSGLSLLALAVPVLLLNLLFVSLLRRRGGPVAEAVAADSAGDSMA
jgi:anti-sigma factor RsiW